MCLSSDGIEDTKHFLLLWSSFDIQRRDLLAVSSEVLTQLLMYGYKYFPYEINRNILELTLDFIHENGPFD